MTITVFNLQYSPISLGALPGRNLTYTAHCGFSLAKSTTWSLMYSLEFNKLESDDHILPHTCRHQDLLLSGTNTYMLLYYLKLWFMIEQAAQTGMQLSTKGSRFCVNSIINNFHHIPSSCIICSKWYIR